MSHIVAIMQPYLFPYFGYFQLLNAVDQFVLYDDVQFIKGGWINRNYLLMNGQRCLFTFSLKAHSTFSKISTCELSSHYPDERKRFIKTLKMAYTKAPHYEAVMPLVENILPAQGGNMVDVIASSLVQIEAYLEISTPLTRASALLGTDDKSGEERVISLCRGLNTSRYINPVGGDGLYCKKRFAEAGIKLDFLLPRPEPYLQLKHTFQPNLSIIDVLMFNAPQRIREMLNEYEIV